MRAFHDPHADVVDIRLFDTDDRRPVHGEDIEHSTIVHEDDAGVAIGVEIIGVTPGLEGLAAAARRYGLAHDELEAAARAALAVPFREVTITIAAEVRA